MSKILLVEDHPAGALVASTMLSAFGYECDVVQSGEEALNKIRDKHYIAALMDVRLNGAMSGVDTVRKLRAWERSEQRGHLPVIAMTACAMVEDKEQCLAVGMDDYISKPFDPDELQEKLAKLRRPRLVAA